MPTLISLFASMSSYYSLPPNLLSSLCYIESAHNTKAINKNDGGSASLGVCQVKLATAKWLGFKGTAKQLMLPRNNVKYAAKFLHYQLKRYKNTERAVIAYNRGNSKNLTRTKYSAKVMNVWRSQWALN